MQPIGQIHVCGIFVEHSHDISQQYSEKCPMKFHEIFPNNVPGILNIGIFPKCPNEYPTNVTCIF